MADVQNGGEGVLALSRGELGWIFVSGSIATYDEGEYSSIKY